MRIFKTIALTSVLLTGTAFAMSASVAPIVDGFSNDYKLVPNVPQVFDNFIFYTISASCVMSTKHGDQELEVTVLRKSGSLNGKKLSQGDSETLMVKDGQKITFSIESTGKVKLVNKGEHDIKASCSLLN